MIIHGLVEGERKSGRWPPSLKASTVSTVNFTIIQFWSTSEHYRTVEVKFRSFDFLWCVPSDLFKNNMINGPDNLLNHGEPYYIFRFGNGLRWHIPGRNNWSISEQLFNKLSWPGHQRLHTWQHPCAHLRLKQSQQNSGVCCKASNGWLAAMQNARILVLGVASQKKVVSRLFRYPWWPRQTKTTDTKQERVLSIYIYIHLFSVYR